MASPIVAKPCSYCRRLKRPDQLIETHSRRMICFDCSEQYNMCEVCGSTTFENYGPTGQLHYEPVCFQ